MSQQLVPALIGFIGLVIGAFPTYVFMRQKKLAELHKLNAETDKIRAEAEKIRAEFDTYTPDEFGRVKLLFAAAEPMDFGPLRLAAEIRGITHGLRSSRHGAAFQLEHLWGVRWDDLRSQLLRDTPNILHFAGHATETAVFFEDDRGMAEEISAEHMAALFSLFADRLRLVVVNTTSSEQFCETLARKVDYVIGASGSVADLDAIKFSEAFYEALADGKSVGTAFEFALANSRSTVNGYKLFTYRNATEPLFLPIKEQKSR